MSTIVATEANQSLSEAGVAESVSLIATWDGPIAAVRSGERIAIVENPSARMADGHPVGPGVEAVLEAYHVVDHPGLSGKSPAFL